MDRNIHFIVILIDDAYHFLIAFTSRNTNQAAKLTDSKIHMYDKVARFHFLQLFHRKRHFTSTSRIRTQIVFMKTVKNLMICKETAFLV